MSDVEVPFVDVSGPQKTTRGSASETGRIPSLEALKSKVRSYGRSIDQLRTKSNLIRFNRKEEFWRATENLTQKKMWIEQDIADYEIIGVEGWKEFGKEIDQSFEQLENDYRKVLSIMRSSGREGP